MCLRGGHLSLNDLVCYITHGGGTFRLIGFFSFRSTCIFFLTFVHFSSLHLVPLATSFVSVFRERLLRCLVDVRTLTLLRTLCCFSLLSMILHRLESLKTSNSTAFPLFRKNEKLCFRSSLSHLSSLAPRLCDTTFRKGCLTSFSVGEPSLHANGHLLQKCK